MKLSSSSADAPAEYYEPIRRTGPPACISALIAAVEEIDHLVKNATQLQKLRELFGLGSLTHADDFLNVLSLPLSGWQMRTWNADQSKNPFYQFCEALVPENDSALDVQAVIQRYGWYIKHRFASLCPYEDQDLCFGTHDPRYVVPVRRHTASRASSMYKEDDLKQRWRLWTWQYCTVRSSQAVRSIC
jgi:hypothetical protein